MKDKLSILAEVDASRAAISRDYREIHAAFDLKRRVAAFIRGAPWAWTGAAAASGFVFSGLLRLPSAILRRRKGSTSPTAKSAARVTFWGFLLALIKLALPFAKPLLTAYAARGLTDLAGSFTTKAGKDSAA